MSGASAVVARGACALDRQPELAAWGTRPLPRRATLAPAADQVSEQTAGVGADCGCECVGYQAHDSEGREHPNATLNDLVQSVRFTGRIGVVGVYVPADPGGPDDLARSGEVVFDYGMFWFKGQRMGTGQCPVKAYNRHLRDLVHEGKARPSFIVSHELPLAQAPEGYEHFDARDSGWTKVVLQPAA